uniref:ECSIT signaling integrator n=1 Tax=Nomascus leucogenys TaxID=61853 RepID=A0A2I3GW39_NOMLE
MSWVQATLLARGLCRAWGGSCGAALTGTSISQVPLPKDSTGAADPPQPHIVGIQSPDQQAALARHSPARPVFVEGPFSLWLRNKCVYYHILRADLLPPEERANYTLGSLGEEHALSGGVRRASWQNTEDPGVEEGPVFAMCMAGAHDQATLAKWIQGLQETNPTLAQIPLQTSSAGLEEPPLPEDHQEEDDNLQRQQQGQS